MSKTKLEKVLEHLLNNQEGQAKALLHQIFIEKARSIHEDLMTQEEEGDDFGMGGSGSDEDDFLGATKHRDSGIADDEDEIEFEEVMSEEDQDDDMADVVDDGADDDMGGQDDMDMDMDMDGQDDDMDGQDDMGGEAGEMQGMEKGIDALSKALEDLQAEFDRLQGHEAGEEAGEEGEDDMDLGDEEGQGEGDVMDDQEGGAEDDDVEENWLHEEDDWDDLAEGLKLDVVTSDMLNQQKTPGEVGSGPKFSGDVGRSVKSPLPASQKDRMGAGPVTMGKGAEKSGYERESAPSSATLKHTQGDNRRSKATQGMSSVSKEGAAGALLNKSTEGNKRSPLSRAPAK